MELKSSSVFKFAKIQSVFQSYLYGIEIGLAWTDSADIAVSIVPLWNWNFSAIITQNFHCCFNRTFMELKSDKTAHVLDTALLVSIVPLWNWNQTKFNFTRFHASFNRTFMELKFKTNFIICICKQLYINCLWLKR